MIGKLGVPYTPKSNEERKFLASYLVSCTFLPTLRTDLECSLLTLQVERSHPLARFDVEVRDENIQMAQFMWWEKSYFDNPYLRTLSLEELNHRFNDIINNMIRINKAGKVGLGSIEKEEVQWAGTYIM